MALRFMLTDKLTGEILTEESFPSFHDAKDAAQEFGGMRKVDITPIRPSWVTLDPIQ